MTSLRPAATQLGTFATGRFDLFAKPSMNDRCLRKRDARIRPVSTNCVEKLCLIEAPGADSLLLGAGDSADDGRAAGDAGGAVLRLQS